MQGDIAGRRRSGLGGALLGPFLALRLGEELDLEPLDARALEVDDREAKRAVLDLIPLFGRAAEQAEDVSADRVVVLDRQLGSELLVEVVDREGAVDAD